MQSSKIRFKFLPLNTKDFKNIIEKSFTLTGTWRAPTIDISCERHKSWNLGRKLSFLTCLLQMGVHLTWVDLLSLNFNMHDYFPVCPSVCLSLSVSICACVLIHFFCWQSVFHTNACIFAHIKTLICIRVSHLLPFPSYHCYFDWFFITSQKHHCRHLLKEFSIHVKFYR